MDPQALSESRVTQAVFIAVPLVIVGWVNLGLGRATAACGDSPQQSTRIVRRFQLGAATWLIAVTAAAASGALAQWQRVPPPFVLLAVGVLVLGVVAARSAAGDRLARGLPLAYLVGFQAFRLPLELAMHRAYTEGLMPVQMSYAGRNFDIVTGATALVLGGALLWTRVPRWLVLLWNLMGLGLLVNIVGVAIASTPRFQYFGPDHVNTFVTRWPYVYLPAVMVLAAWAGHLIVFRALRGGPAQP